jgi:hypothetical protein
MRSEVRALVIGSVLAFLSIGTAAGGSVSGRRADLAELRNETRE